LVIAVDSSKSSADTDYKPCRLEVTKACVSKFIAEYYDQNPISQLGVIATRDRTSDRLTELSGNPKNHIHTIKTVKNMSGLASLQNTMLLGMSMLRHIPNYGHREMLIIFSSLSTCDPGDIFSSIKDAKAQKVRVSVICLVAEVFICKQIAELTGGTFAVALDATHLSELLLTHTIPPPEVQRNESLVTDFIYMGFPKRTFDSHSSLGFDGKKMKLSANAYICPRCSTRTTDIPTQCCVCNLQLNSSSHIARSYHHLFPVQNYVEYEVRESTITDSATASANANSSKGEPMVEVSVSATAPLTLKLKRGGDPGRKQQQQQAAVKVFTAVRLEPVDRTYHEVPLKEEENTSGDSSSAMVESKSATTEEVSALENEVVLGSVSAATNNFIYGTANNMENLHRCRGCLENVCKDKKLLLRCPSCRCFFCMECDLFVHDSLHNCPGCQ
jgi:hypothetical protein